jgi:glycosyltransferase involved in cell wall biosynthesis
MGSTWADTPAQFPSNVTVITDAPHDVVMEAWARCRLGVVPSLWPEPLGLVALEALAMGRPLIASRIGGLMDIVRHGETGLLITPGDVDGLRAVMRTLLHDDALGTHLGRMGRQQVLSRFTASVVVPQIEDIYARVLSKRVPAPIG